MIQISNLRSATRPETDPSLYDTSVQGRASLWALLTVTVACVVFELSGGPRSGLLGIRSFLVEAGNFVITVPPGIYFTVYCLIVSASSSLRGLRKYAAVAVCTLLPSILFLPSGLMPDDMGPPIYVMSMTAGIAVGMLTWFMFGLPGIAAGVLTAATAALVPVAVSELGRPYWERIPFLRHWLGILGAGFLTFGAFLAAVNTNIVGITLLAPLCTLPHVVAAGGFREALRLIRRIS